MKSGLSLVLALILLLASLACSHRKTYALQGEVRGKDLTTNEITVKHGDIPGFMPAMTMQYRVKNTADHCKNFSPGDKIAAEVIVSKDGNEYWLEDVRITDESGRGKVKPAETHMLRPGEKVPDVPLREPGRKNDPSQGLFGEGGIGHLYLYAMPSANLLSSSEQSIRQDSQ